MNGASFRCSSAFSKVTASLVVFGIMALSCVAGAAAAKDVRFPVNIECSGCNISHDFGDYSSYLSGYYHAAIDIGAGCTPSATIHCPPAPLIYPVAPGKVVAVHKGRSNLLGNAIILEHEGLPFRYSLYAHLENFSDEIGRIASEPYCVNDNRNDGNTCVYTHSGPEEKNEIRVDVNSSIGVMGGTPGEMYSVHLHLEFRSFIERGQKCPTDSWAYTEDHPSSCGWFDPFGSEIAFVPGTYSPLKEFQVEITDEGNGANLRIFPMNGYSGVVRQVAKNERFIVVGETGMSASLSDCSKNWYRVRMSEAEFTFERKRNLSAGENKELEIIKTKYAWLCRGNEKEDWVRTLLSGDVPPDSRLSSAIAIVADVSGSMNDRVTVVDQGGVTKSERKLDVAKNAIRSLAVTASQANAANSLSTFSQDGSTIVHMGSGSDHRDRFEAAVTGLSAGGGTNIGAGLEQGFAQLASGGSGCAVLMSDGQNTVGSFDSAVGRFSSAGVPIYTVGFGEEAGRAELLGIARETGGTFWLAGATNLGSVFLDSGSLCTNTSTTKRVTETMGPGSEVEYTMLVQQGMNEIGGHATWQGSTLDVIMVDPRGRQIPSSALPAQDGQASTGSNYLVFSKRNPEPGTWRLKFFWTDPPPVAEQVNIALTERSDLVMALVGIENEYAVGAPVQIALLTGEVIGQERVPLQDPRMRVRVQKPGSQVVDVVRARSRNLQLLERVVDAATVTIEVHDDGQHEDYHPGDGIFGAVFTDTYEPGVYLIRAEVSGRKSDGTWVQREITATFQVGPLAANPVTAASVLDAVDLLSQRQDPVRAIDAVRSGQIRTAPAPLPRPSTAPNPVLRVRPSQPSLPLESDSFTQTQPRPSQTGPASAIERLRARD